MQAGRDIMIVNQREQKANAVLEVTQVGFTGRVAMNRLRWQPIDEACLAFGIAAAPAQRAAGTAMSGDVRCVR